MAQQISSPPESWCRIDAWPATHAASDFTLLNPLRRGTTSGRQGSFSVSRCPVTLLSLCNAMTG